MIKKRRRASLGGDEDVPKSTVVMVQVPVNTLKTNESHPLNGYIVWYANYTPLKIFFFFKEESEKATDCMMPTIRRSGRGTTMETLKGSVAARR